MRPGRPKTWWQVFRRRFLRSRLAMIGGVGAVALLGVAFSAHLLAPYSPVEMKPAIRLEPPSQAHLLGTDEYGRDVLSRVLYGARISIQVSVSAVAIAMAIGVTLGILAGYFKGATDVVITRFTDILFSFPAILLALLVLAVVGTGVANVIVAIGILYLPIFARITRSAVLTVAEFPYIEAARAIGYSDFWVMQRAILPNVMAPVMVTATLALAVAILIEAALSFLGLGVQPPAPSWGNLIQSGYGYMDFSPWLAIGPGVAISLSVLSLNLLGDGLRDLLDPRLRNL